MRGRRVSAGVPPAMRVRDRRGGGVRVRTQLKRARHGPFPGARPAPWYVSLNPGRFSEWSLWKRTSVSCVVLSSAAGRSEPLNWPIRGLPAQAPFWISR